DPAPEVAGDAAQDDAQHGRERDGDEAYRERDARAVHQPRPLVAAEPVGPEQAWRVAAGGALEPEEVTVGGDEAEEPVGVATREQAQRVARLLVERPLHAQGALVALAPHPVDERPGHAALVEHAHGL